jgi:superfamily II DNA or RNA helicase
MSASEVSLVDAVPRKELKDWAVVSGLGREITANRVIPLLKHSRTYKRATGYFSVRVLLRNAEGIFELIRNHGEMRLILGAHDVPPELVKATRFLNREEAEEVLRRIGNSITDRFDMFVDELSRETIKCIAWMLKNGKLVVKVAIPKDTYLRRANGIFHQKSMVFEDGANVVTATGSGNETVPASTDNGEKWDFHFSWVKGHEWHVSANVKDFDRIWRGEHQDYYVFPLPKAVEMRLWTFYEDLDTQVEVPIQLGPRKHRLGDVARLLLALKGHPYFWHFALGPVRLFPHQVFVADAVLGKYPVRRILADEVGLGKTIEAGAIIKRLAQLGLVKRVLILCPGGLINQWQDEMDRRFNMDFFSYDSTGKELVSPDGTPLPSTNPFRSSGIDLVMCSWHYARKANNRKRLLESDSPFDMIVIDEAHSARKKETGASTLLYKLAKDLSFVTPNILLMTATPIQIDPKEMHGLLSILGLGGEYWEDSASFYTFYRNLSQPEFLRLDDIERILAMVHDGGRRYLRHDLVDHMLTGIDDEQLRTLFGNVIMNGEGIPDFSERMVSSGRMSKLGSDVIPLFGPVHWYMVRNTRDSLQTLEPSVYRFPERRIHDVVVESDSVELESLREDIANYIQKTVTDSLKVIEKEGIVGFMKSILWQRFCSSLHALRKTLIRRKEALSMILEIANSYKDIGEEVFIPLETEEFEDTEDIYGDIDLGVVAMELLDRIVEDYKEYESSELEDRLTEELDVLQDLISRLEEYSMNPLDDPKVQASVDKIEKEYEAGKKLLVFSRYTDTVDILLKALANNGMVPLREMAMFTGKGAMMFQSDLDETVRISKDEISNGLDEGKFRVVLCSDAASEGFNLHPASVVLNVDIPWNPARLEQRIGRADRLGHDPDVPVDVHYVWYKEQDFVERRMYQMIKERDELKKMIIGPAQELVSQNIAKAVASGKSIDSRVAENVAKEIEDLQKSSSELFRVMEGMKLKAGESQVTLDERFESCLRKFFFLSCAELGLELRKEGDKYILEGEFLPDEIPHGNWGRFKLGKSDYISLTHPAMEYLLDSMSSKYPIPAKAAPSIVSIMDQYNASKIIMRENGHERELLPHEIIDFIDAEIERV